jgi:formate dehydrogenase major subunit
MLGRPGKLAPRSWEEAADGAAQLLRDARDKHGAGSVGVIGSSRLTQSEAWALRSLAEEVLKTPHFGSASHLAWVPLGLPNPGRYADIGSADLIVVAGADLLEENPVLGARVMSRCKPAGDRPYVSPDIGHLIPPEPAPLVWANSRPSDLADAAAVRIQPRPGGEWLLLAAMLRRMVSSGPCQAKGVERARESLNNSNIEKHLAQAGIAPKDAAKAASLLEKAQRPLLIVGRGLWQQEQAGQALAALANLSLAAEKLKVMQAAPGANDAGCGEILFPGNGLGYAEMMEAAVSGKIKALVLAGEDPLRSLPGNGPVSQALSSLEALVVIDCFASNRAIASAHAVLPIPLPLEKDGAFRNIEGSLQDFKAAAAPPPEVRGLADILSRWAKIMGGSINESGQVKIPRRTELLEIKFTEPNAKDDAFRLELGTAYPHLAGGELFTEGTPHLAREFAGGWAELHPDDIAELGIRAGWRARFATEAGKMEMVVRANPRMLSKTIYMPVHFGANALAPMKFDQELKTPVLRGIPARVEKI